VQALAQTRYAIAIGSVTAARRQLELVFRVLRDRHVRATVWLRLLTPLRQV
jgi:hypothetical protein